MTRPICTWECDGEANITIYVSRENVEAFGRWLSDEWGNSEEEMYELMEAMQGRDE